MNGDQTASLIGAVMMIVLVGSGLIARRLPIGATIKMVLSWCAIFGIIFVLFMFRGEAGQVLSRLKSEFSPGGVIEKDGTLRVRKAEDGHFWLDTKINGRDMRLMVDSGATTTGISLTTAQAMGIDIDTSGFPVNVETANGNVEARRARIDDFAVGHIRRGNFPVLVSDSFGDTNVVGMNFLSTLKSWRVEGDFLVLTP